MISKLHLSNCVSLKVVRMRCQDCCCEQQKNVQWGKKLKHIFLLAILPEVILIRSVGFCSHLVVEEIFDLVISRYVVLNIISQPFRKMKRMLWKTTRRQLFKNASLDYCFFVKWNWSVLDKACVKILIWKIHLNFIIQKFKLNKTKFSEKENGVLQGETNLTRMLGCTRMYWVVLCCAGLHWAVLCCAVL